MAKAPFIGRMSPAFLRISLAATGLLASAGGGLATEPESSVVSPGASATAAGPLISAIKDAESSIIEVAPKCGYGTRLTGALVMETPKRAGFPFNATTFASPQGIFTTITTSGDESEATINEVARILNSRADEYVRRLLRNCSL